MQNKEQNIYLGLCLVGLILALVLPWIRLLLFMALFFYGASLGLYRENKSRLFRRLTIIFIFILASALPLIFTRIGGANDSETLIAWSSWGITKASLELGVLVSLRAITAFGAVLLMTQICPIYELFRRLKRSPYCPDLFVELLELVYRYIHVLDEMRRQIYEAQVCRLAYTGSFRERIQDTTMLISRTFVQAHSEVNKLYDGLLSRAFESNETDETDTEQEIPFNTQRMNSKDHSHKLITLEGVGYQYEKKHIALQGINLKIAQGERIVLLGENGAGKSTLMKLLCGLLPMQSGKFHLAGEEVTPKAQSLKALRRQIALVFQNANHQLFCASVEDEIAFGLRNIGLEETEVQAKVEQILLDFGLNELRTIPPHKLSEGQKKWVSLAAILALEPQVILLDEPTASLDRYHTKKVLNLLSKLNTEGKTIILSTHNMDLAYEWAERILVMSKGQMLRDASPKEIFSDKALLKQALLDEPYQLKHKA